MPRPVANRLISLIVVAVGIAVGAAVVTLASGTGALPQPHPSAADLRERASRGEGKPGHARWVAEENAKPGTTDWQIHGPLNHDDIVGYADTTSATQGTTVALYVSTDAPSFRVEAYRMGYYGGQQGRLIWRSDTLPGERQAAPYLDPTTRMIEARWHPSLRVTLDRAWVPGDYLLKLVASNAYEHYIPLAVRDDDSQAAFVVQNSVTTWQAYNTWGGYGLYEGLNARGVSVVDRRSEVVSFDRPYENDSGAGDFLGNELPLVSLVEGLGLDVTYWTDIDLHRQPERLTSHRALLSLGHDEYWSLEMREGAQRARDAGVNLAFFGANAVYRSIRLSASSLGPLRREVNYRLAHLDPMTGLDDSRVTVSWREPPLNRPESTLVGDFYQCNPVKADMVVADPTAWVFAGTGLGSGDKLKNLVGPEYDRYDTQAPPPPGSVQVLTHSPLRCHGQASYSDMTYYSTGSGAGVFATGTNWWISRLGPDCPPKDCQDPKVVQITENVLDAFGAGPAGPAHPSRANASQLPTERGPSTVPGPEDEHASPVVSPSGRRPNATDTTVAYQPESSPRLPPLPFPGPRRSGR